MSVPSLVLGVAALMGSLLGCAGSSLRATPQRAPEAGQQSSASAGPQAITPTAAASATPGPASSTATLAATRRLRQTLAKLAELRGFALGHEDTTAYGVGWRTEAARSDVKDVCGSYPAVYGWDIFRIELDSPQNGDGVDFDLMRAHIQAAHQRGGINTISWHMDNPVSGGDAWDTTRAADALVPGGTHHRLFVSYLDRAAAFLQSLRGEQGELIPVIFRPFHEHTGSWFWWGAKHTSDETFIRLWRFTADHLRETHGLGQLLLAFSPGGSELKRQEDYWFRYPGDDYVDVMGVDYYFDTDVSGLVRAVSFAVLAADQRGKVAALTEFGMRDGLSDDTPRDWFRRNFFDPLLEGTATSRIAYALAWRNANPEHFFLPHPGHPTAADFAALCRDPRLLLQRDLPL